MGSSRKVHFNIEHQGRAYIHALFPNNPAELKRVLDGFCARHQLIPYATHFWHKDQLLDPNGEYADLLFLDNSRINCTTDHYYHWVGL
jgi:hypothetical protein